MKKIKVAINGMGRIGRAFYRLAVKEPALQIVAVNDLADINNLVYLLTHDSVYGKNLQPTTDNLQQVQYFSEKDPAKLPWKELDIDVVVEATGFFNTAEGAGKHLEAGARRVVITAPLKEQSRTDADFTRTDADKTTTPQSPPLKGGEGKTILMGVNEKDLATCIISSNASCTTNAAAPIIAIMDEAIGVESALLNTVHAYTATQSLVDSPAGKKGMREGRAAAANIVPSSTGAAIAVTKAYPSLAGKFDGISLRVPVLCGSIADVTFIAKRDTSAEEVNEILRKAAKEKRWQGIFSASDDELVSSDIIGATEGAIAELSMTRVVGGPSAPLDKTRGKQLGTGNLVKVLAWYDNEAGYAATLVRHVLAVGEVLGPG